jgi:hypothetical protein
MNSAEAVTFIPVASTVSFIANHAKDAVDINTAETKSMTNAGMSFLVSFIVSLLFLNYLNSRLPEKINHSVGRP